MVGHQEKMSGSKIISLQCECCDSSHYTEQDLLHHLRETHSITKGLEDCLLRARQGNTNKAKRKIYEVDLEAEELDTEKELLKMDNLEDIIRKSLGGIFQDLDIMLDGILPEADQEKTDDRHYPDSPLQEEIQKCCDEVRSVINNMKIPEHFINEVAPKSKERRKSLEKKSDSKHIMSYICQVSDCTFQTDKAGLENGEAAKHLYSHRLTSNVIKKSGPLFKSLREK